LDLQCPPRGPTNRGGSLMAGRGPAPKVVRRRRNTPARGEWQPAPGAGWRFGEPPPPPTRLLTTTRAVWNGWFHGWWASNWTPEYLSQIIIAIRLYDEFLRGDSRVATELRQAMDGIGVTWRGQQDRRWAPPKADEQAPAAVASGSQYAGLRVVGQ
jgi:hypothetical protein